MREKHYVGHVLEVFNNSEYAQSTFLRHKNNSIFGYPHKEDKSLIPFADILKELTVCKLGSSLRQNGLLYFDPDVLRCYPNIY